MLNAVHHFTTPTPIALSCIARKWGGAGQDLSMDEFMERLSKKDRKLFNKLETFLEMAKSGVYEVQNVSASNSNAGWPTSVWIISSHNMCWATADVGFTLPFEFFSEDQLCATLYMRVEGMEKAVPINLVSLKRLL